jgi:hypothetical protein
MYVEAICPLCLHTHIVPADMRGERYRCEECEEVFIINRRSKKTHRRPPRARTVRPADELDEVVPADEAEVLPVGTGSRGKRRRRIDDEADRPRKRPARRPGTRVGLVVGLSAGAVLLLGLAGAGVWWAFWGRGDSKDQAKTSPTHDGPIPVAVGRPPADAEPPKNDPPRPKAGPPKNDPPKPEARLAWNVKVDRPAVTVRLPADFKKEITARATNTEVVFPTATGSPFVAVGDNFDDKDERQVWNLQADAPAGKLVGRRYSAGPPVLSPDGAHLAIIPFGEHKIVDVAALASGKAVRIDTDLETEVVDFVGPGKLLVAGKQGANLRLRVWDAATGKREHDFDGPPLGTPPTALRDTVAVSPGGAYLAVVTPDDLWLWDLKTGAAAGRHPLPWNAGNWLLPCRGLSFSPDGTELAALFQVKGQSRLVCWDVARGEAVFDVTFPALRLWAGTEMAYRGHVLGWVGERRGWLLYGQMFLDRKADRVGPAPAGLLAPDQPFRRMVGPDHVATLPGGLGGHKVLTISPFDPGKLK